MKKSGFWDDFYSMDIYNEWWPVAVFLVMLFSGMTGGLSRFHWEKMDDSELSGWWRYALTGMAAALLVPLFLNTISSTLIVDTQKEPGKFFLLAGFCIGAGIFSKQFIGSVARRALKLSQDAKELASEASEVALRAEHRAIVMSAVTGYVHKGRYREALYEIGKILQADPASSEALAWKAFCLKRLKDYSGAVLAMEKAIEYSRREIQEWYYNLACYYSLNQESIDKVMDTLQYAREMGTELQNAHMKVDLKRDRDFERIRKNARFVSFVNELRD